MGIHIANKELGILFQSQLAFHALVFHDVSVDVPLSLDTWKKNNANLTFLLMEHNQFKQTIALQFPCTA